MKTKVKPEDFKVIDKEKTKIGFPTYEEIISRWIVNSLIHKIC